MILHFARDHRVPLNQQKKEILNHYPNAKYIGVYRGIITVIIPRT